MRKLLQIPKPVNGEEIKCPHCFEYVNILYCKNCHNYIIFPLFSTAIIYRTDNYESSQATRRHSN